MPIREDIRDHSIFGPIYNRGLAEGREESKRQTIHMLLQDRFGAVPDRVERRIERMTIPEIDWLIVHVHRAETLNALLAEVPALSDTWKQSVFSGKYKRGWDEGYSEGWQQGYSQGLEEARREAVRRRFQQRFGVVPPWVHDQLRK